MRCAGSTTGWACGGCAPSMPRSAGGAPTPGPGSWARPVGASDVVCFGRDLEVTYRVWSPKAGYPGHAAYRDFHTFDHPTGLKPARVTGKHIPPDRKRPYDPELAAAVVHRHANDFVD